MNPADILILLNEVGSLLIRSREAYAKIREAAEKGGVTAEDLAAADQRALHHYEDPLKK